MFLSQDGLYVTANNWGLVLFVKWVSSISCTLSIVVGGQNIGQMNLFKDFPAGDVVKLRERTGSQGRASTSA